MNPGLPADERLQTARWRLLTASAAEDARVFTDEFARAADDLSATGDPCWDAWSAAFTARAALFDADLDGAADAVGAARAALAECLPSAEHALTLAYLAHLEVAADRFDAAMHLAVDASLLADQLSDEPPSRPLHQAHHWLSLALTRLDLEELAVAQSLRGARVAAALPDLGDQWQLLRLCAQQHAELAQTVHRRGQSERSHELAQAALECATSARALPWDPSDADADLLDVVQAWALTLAGQLDDALPPLRRVRRHLAAGDGGVWLVGYTDLVLARLLSRSCAAQPGTDRGAGEEAVGLLVDASGAFAAVNDRRRYRQCLLELGQTTAAMGSTTEALHWLEAYRAETTRAHRRGRELWAEMFVRRSRLREAERQTAVLRRHALEDTLTGLGNRRSAERRLAELPLDGEPMSLAVVDVDGFKSVNDQNSHLHGDAVLRRVAELLRQHSRTGDEAFRWAGDEFVVVLPNTTEAQALVATERLRSAVACAEWGDLQIPAPVTVSIGVATTGPAGSPGPRSWRELFDRADLNLFGAKRGGRNRVRASGGAQQGGASTARSGVLPPDASVDDLVAEVLGTTPRRPGWAFDDGAEVAS
ncbi:GGDEF domain-containing protein [Modestobacter sp. VKM Ac-2984]|uniref:GGDEF domain-containing protein n=1 Tax=Modestobacter sp. VKM Ac-2984 TaxID=3004138 RepID=UPI0022AAF3AD|nr:GGDEF domain-containing protein [Modestobacter sp. VKM Ac-2984]MCZ2817195.1 GGDEF domain-containing protein [Modestobacter sp. VKM Ac-2984]